jgi:pimeloyl-ACP methyl ester carboxylesterase
MKFLKTLVLASAALIAGQTMAAEKPTIVLVHGAFETSKAWDYLVPKLESDGYHVINVDLPGRPGNPMAPNLVSLDLYRDTVLKAIAGEKNPVVVVGHSFGGIVISAVGEADPDKIKTLVYVAAYLPQDGQSMLSLATGDRDSKAGPALDIDKAKGIVTVKYAARGDLFANGAPEAVQKAVADSVVPEPLGPLATPVHLTAARFGKIDKVYIHTALDQVVSPWLQQKMVDATPVRLQMTLETGHLPFVVDVPGTAADIEKAAQ